MPDPGLSGAAGDGGRCEGPEGAGLILRADAGAAVGACKNGAGRPRLSDCVHDCSSPRDSPPILDDGGKDVRLALAGAEKEVATTATVTAITATAARTAANENSKAGFTIEVGILPPYHDDDNDDSDTRNNDCLLPPPSTYSPSAKNPAGRVCGKEGNGGGDEEEMLRVPRLRRRGVRLLGHAALILAVGTFVYCFVLGGAWGEPVMLGANMNVAKRLGYKQVADLPDAVIPRDGEGEEDAAEKRLVLVGDVHGMFDELQTLLAQLSFDPNSDHLVFTGDMITRGPDSLKVLSFASDSGASCVRGNNEDRVMLHYHDLHSTPTSPFTSSPSSSTTPSFSSAEDAANEISIQSSKKNGKKGKGKTRKPAKRMPAPAKLAKMLSPEQARWVDECPLILRASGVHGLGDIAVVHAGLVPGIPLENQDPLAAMNMKSLDKKYGVHSHASSGHHWADIWNKHEKHSKSPLTVVYGHYAAKGLDLRPLTKGLDSGCVRGGKLTALVVSNKKKPHTESVRCRKFAD